METLQQRGTKEKLFVGSKAETANLQKDSVENFNYFDGVFPERGKNEE